MISALGPCFFKISITNCFFICRTCFPSRSRFACFPLTCLCYQSVARVFCPRPVSRPWPDPVCCPGCPCFLSRVLLVLSVPSLCFSFSRSVLCLLSPLLLCFILHYSTLHYSLCFPNVTILSVGTTFQFSAVARNEPHISRRLASTVSPLYFTPSRASQLKEITHL